MTWASPTVRSIHPGGSFFLMSGSTIQNYSASPVQVIDNLADKLGGLNFYRQVLHLDIEHISAHAHLIAEVMDFACVEHVVDVVLQFADHVGRKSRQV